jgi:hypothetical protein
MKKGKTRNETSRALAAILAAFLIFSSAAQARPVTLPVFSKTKITGVK